MVMLTADMFQIWSTLAGLGESNKQPRSQVLSPTCLRRDGYRENPGNEVVNKGNGKRRNIFLILPTIFNHLLLRDNSRYNTERLLLMKIVRCSPKLQY